MDDKVLIKLIVPEIDTSYDIYLPITKKIGNIVILLNRAINELSMGVYPISNTNKLYNATNNESLFFINYGDEIRLYSLEETEKIIELIYNYFILYSFYIYINL